MAWILSGRDASVALNYYTCEIVSCYNKQLVALVLYMSSNFWLLGVESRGLSQAEKERIACKAEQIHKMTTIFTQNDNLGPLVVSL